MSKSESFAVIGGEGFLGHALVEALHAKYPSSPVISLDVVQRHFPEKAEWTFGSCDLTSLASLTSTFTTHATTTVFHTASPIVGREGVNGKEIFEKVNIKGTATIIQACRDNKVKKLVYTSSSSVAFDGSDLISVDERCYAEKPLGAYNDTKARADAMVLAANGKDGLLTCCIRPAGIMGPGDRTLIPGFIRILKTGKHKISIGDNLNIIDMTYIDNVIHAFLLAGEKLDSKVHISVFDQRIKPTNASFPRRILPTSASIRLPEDVAVQQTKAETDVLDLALPPMRNRFDQWFDLQHIDPENPTDAYIPVAGQAYYISNGEPLSFWAFARALWFEYAGYTKSTWKLPAEVGLLYVTIENAICRLFGRHSSMPKEYVYYSIAKRYYNIEKARRILGYEPIVGLNQGIRMGVRWYKDNEESVDAALYGRKVVEGKELRTSTL